MRFGIALAIALAAVAGSMSCSQSAPVTTQPRPDAGQPMLTQAQLMDPQACNDCHRARLQEWSGSMHAYAGEDPVFLAMNARGQRETGGALGNFCVKCHAPLALKMGLTKDGLNLASLPKETKGINCYFCHTAGSIDGSNNNPLVLASDNVLRGEIQDPSPQFRPHGAVYSPLHDQKSIGSAAMCGGCHDIQNQHGIDIEKTFAEWRNSEFAVLQGSVDNTRTCGACHMPASDGLAADVPNAPMRKVHDHSMAGVDIALTSFADRDNQRALVQKNLDGAVTLKLCVTGTPGANVEVTLESQNVGHAWPSGASQDRRAWVEMIATAGTNVVFQTGVVPDGQPVGSIVDPNLWLLKQTLLDKDSKEVDFMWQALLAGTTVGLKPPLSANPKDPGYAHSVTRKFDVPLNADRITARVRIVPIRQELLDNLAASGDLDMAVRPQMPTFTLARTVSTWTAGGAACVP